MSKLKCTLDKRRVMVLKGNRVIHRSDGTVCKTTTVWISKYQYPIGEVRFFPSNS